MAKLHATQGVATDVFIFPQLKQNCDFGDNLRNKETKEVITQHMILFRDGSEK